MKASTQLSVGKILLTLAAIIYGFIPPFASFNATHAMNPLWIGHARFHGVWQVMITFNLAVLSLYLIWNKVIEPALSLRLSFLLGLIVVGSFWVNALIKPWYGGAFSDENAYRPLAVNGIDANIYYYAINLLLLIIGYFLTKKSIARTFF